MSLEAGFPLEMAQHYLLVTDVSAGWLESALQQVPDENVHVLLPVGADGDITGLPKGWEVVGPSVLADQARFRREFLRFVNDWPAQVVLNRRSFDDLFRHSGGYSVWWTGPGIERNVDVRVGVFPTLNTLWTVDHAIRALAPAKVFIYSRSAELTAVLISRCERDQLPFEILKGSARPRSTTWDGRSAWLLNSLRSLLVYPAKVFIRSLAARLYAKTNMRATPEHPTIVFTSPFARYVRARGDGLSVWFWQALCDRITALAPQTRCCHLLRLGREFPGHRAVSFFYHTAWPLLRKIDDVGPPKERYAALGFWLRSVPGQLLALWRYFRIEAQPQFRQSFLFAGADISSLYVPHLRKAVAGISEWAQTVGSIVRSLEAVGNVKAMLVSEEMYRPGMLNIAAARTLRIPTIGVQHGMIMPIHLMYTLPSGQVVGAPIPDYFAATSTYVKEVMSEQGAYPADRIWVTGSPRFDELVNNPPDRQQARKRLGLPADRQVVLVTTQTAAWFRVAVRAVFEAVGRRDHCLVCVKVHPKTIALSSEAYRAMAQQVGAANVLCFDDRFDDLLAACDVLISASSTTILEATLLGRPTICVNFSGEPDRYPYVQDGASVPVRSPGEMEQALDLVLSPHGGRSREAERRRFLDRHAGPSAAGRAGAELARRIVELARPDAAGVDPLPTHHVETAAAAVSEPHVM